MHLEWEVGWWIRQIIKYTPPKNWIGECGLDGQACTSNQPSGFLILVPSDFGKLSLRRVWVCVADGQVSRPRSSRHVDSRLHVAGRRSRGPGMLRARQSQHQCARPAEPEGEDTPPAPWGGTQQAKQSSTCYCYFVTQGVQVPQRKCKKGIKVFFQLFLILWAFTLNINDCTD